VLRVKKAVIDPRDASTARFTVMAATMTRRASMAASRTPTRALNT
jgi:hypothetical protein